MSRRVLILGVTGMLGHTCFEYFKELKDFETYGTWRNPNEKQITNFDALNGSIGEIIDKIKPDLIINCIGLIKQKINEADQVSVASTFRINEAFPRELAEIVAGTDVNVIQIATDCVFNGVDGQYDETSPHNATDIYGKSKSLGEIVAPEFMNLRVSIIGREVRSNFSLVDWFLSQNFGAQVNGYSNHLWNGITTTAFAKIAAGIAQSDNFVSGTYHIAPSDIVSKYELLVLLKKYFDREDILIRSVDTSTHVDRTLRTIHMELNRNLWKQAGYRSIPSIEELVKELKFSN